MTVVSDYIEWHQETRRKFGPRSMALVQVGQFAESYTYVDQDGSFTLPGFDDFLSITGLATGNKALSGKKCKMAGVPVSQLDKYVNILVDAGWTVAYYKQDIPAANSTRSLDRIYSPSVRIDDEGTEGNGLMILVAHRSRSGSRLGMCTISTTTGAVGLREFGLGKDLDGLEQEVAPLLGEQCPAEVVCVAGTEEDIVRLEACIALTGARCHAPRPPHVLKGEGLAGLIAESALQRIQKACLESAYGEGEAEQWLFYREADISLAVQALALGLRFVRDHSKNLACSLRPPVIINPDDTLRLANYGLRQLNIIDDQRHKGKASSLVAAMDCTLTAGGRRKLKHCLTHPSADLVAIEGAQAMTQSINLEDRTRLRASLRGVHDMDRAYRRLVAGYLTKNELPYIYQALRVITEQLVGDLGKKLKRRIDALIDDEGHCEERLGIASGMMGWMDARIDLDACCTSDTGPGCLWIRQGFDGQLDKLRDAYHSVKKRLDKVCLAFGSVAPVKLVAPVKSAGYLSVTSKRAVDIEASINFEQQSKSARIVIGTLLQEVGVDPTKVKFPMSRRGKDVRISSPDLDSMCNELFELQCQLDEAQRNAIRSLRAAMLNDGGFRALPDIASILSEIDLIQCRAHVFARPGYCIPKMVEGTRSFMQIEALRHPLIEQLLTKSLYVPNNAKWGLHEDCQQLALIYGTNAVGKTSYIRAVGLAVVLAQAGFPVPCKAMTLCPYSAIFTRISNNDDLFRGQSTFAVEMSELRTILLSADNRSLVLGDELCSGTEGTSAVSIFAAGLEAMAQAGSTAILSSHFHELTGVPCLRELQNSGDLGIYHMKVKYNAASATIEYDRTLATGAGLQMYGLEVCKGMKMPAAFLNRAMEIRTGPRSFTGKQSRYSGRVFLGMCDLCKTEQAMETHHLRHQASASSDQSLEDGTHVHHPGNLAALCGNCHRKIHKEGGEHKWVDTTNGRELVRISDVVV